MTSAEKILGVRDVEDADQSGTMSSSLTTVQGLPAAGAERSVLVKRTSETGTEGRCGAGTNTGPGRARRRRCVHQRLISGVGWTFHDGRGSVADQ
jgi:hypothetical protein